MLINGIELSEPEIRAKLKAMADEIVRLNELLKRYEAEKYAISEKLGDIEKDYNAQTTVIGFLEDDNKRFDDENKELKRLLKLATEHIRLLIESSITCEACALYDTATTDCMGEEDKRCSDMCKWKYADEALKLIRGE